MRLMCENDWTGAGRTDIRRIGFRMQGQNDTLAREGKLITLNI